MAGKGGVGIELNLDKVPQRETGMTAYEMMLSESQERMLMVLRPDRRVSPFADRQAENSFFNKQRELKRVEQPFKEKRRAKMGDCETRPIEYLLGDEGFLA